MDGEDKMEELLKNAGEGEAKTNVKSRSPWRWMILVMSSFCMFASYYCYDNPSALFDQLEDNGLSSTQINSLYSAYSFPNMVLPFFGGYLVDRYGVRRTLVAFSFFLVVGQTVVALGFTINSGKGNAAFAVMMIGRFIYGLGGESLCVAAQTLLAEWFMGKEMALAMGINLSISRLGSVVNDQTSVALAKELSLSGTFWAGVFLLVGGFAGALATAAIDKKVSEQEEEIGDAPKRSMVEQALKRSFAATNQASFNAGSSHKKSVSAKSFADSVSAEKHPKLDEEVEDLSFGEIVRSIKQFKKTFWLLCIGCVVVYATVMPFNNIASSFLSHKYYPDYIGDSWVTKDVNGTSVRVCTPYSDDRHSDLKDDASHYANIWMMVPFTISAALSPFLGAFVDRVGMRASLMLISAVVLTGVHLFLGLTNGVAFTGSVGTTSASIDLDWFQHPAVGLSFMGLAYSFYAAAVWPAVVYVVDEDQVGTAYGLVTAVQNTGLAIVPLIVGFLTESTPGCDPSKHSGGYINVEWLFVGFGLLGVGIGCYLHTIPGGRKLNLRDPWQADDDETEDNDLERVSSPGSRVNPTKIADDEAMPENIMG